MARALAQALFAPGGVIQYTFVVDNTGSATSATVKFTAYWNAVDEHSTEIVNASYQNVSIPSGVAGFYNPEFVPKNAVPGPYTILITITYNGTSARGTSPTGDLTVTGNDALSGNGCSLTSAVKGNGLLPGACGCPGKAAATCVTYWDQYAVTPRGSLDCGPASVAMALNYYKQGPSWTTTWTNGRRAGLKAIRSWTGVPGNADIGSAQLGKAIRQYHGSYSMTPATGSLEAIAGAIRSRHPVIAFVGGVALGRGPGYGVRGTGYGVRGTGYGVRGSLAGGQRIHHQRKRAQRGRGLRPRPEPHLPRPRGRHHHHPSRHLRQGHNRRPTGRRQEHDHNWLTTSACRVGPSLHGLGNNGDHPAAGRPEVDGGHRHRVHTRSSACCPDDPAAAEY